MRALLPLFALAGGLFATTCLQAENEISFRETIKPLLREKCVHCHNKKTLPEIVSFESGKLAFTKSRSGQPIIVPGKPDESLMIVALESPVMHEKAMPQTGQRPTKKEIQSLRLWIAEGAPWPKGLAGRIRPTFYPIE